MFVKNPNPQILGLRGFLKGEKWSKYILILKKLVFGCFSSKVLLHILSNLEGDFQLLAIFYYNLIIISEKLW